MEVSFNTYIDEVTLNWTRDILVPGSVRAYRDTAQGQLFPSIRGSRNLFLCRDIPNRGNLSLLLRLSCVSYDVKSGGRGLFKAAQVVHCNVLHLRLTGALIVLILTIYNTLKMV